MAVYAAMVERLDAAVGRVVRDLQRHGEPNHTLVLFLSDNGACAEWDSFGFDGERGPHNVRHRGDGLKKVGGPDSYVSYGSGWTSACNTPWRLYKHYAHEGGISTPLVVHWPARLKAKGVWQTQPGHVMDVLPTLIDVCGARYPGPRDGQAVLPAEGRSLVPAFDGRPLDRPYLAWGHEGNRALRAGWWKVVALQGRPWELYDIVERTPALRRNLALVAVVLLLTGSAARADWPTVRGDVARSGLVREELRPPFRLAWVRHFEGERLGIRRGQHAPDLQDAVNGAAVQVLVRHPRPVVLQGPALEGQRQVAEFLVAEQQRLWLIILVEGLIYSHTGRASCFFAYAAKAGLSRYAPTLSTV
jgi:hypothetical protein